MFMERNYQQEKTNSLVRYCLCAISISVETLAKGLVFGLNVVCLRELGGTCLYKDTSAGSFCHLGACFDGWAERQAHSEVSEITAKWRGLLFLLMHLKLAPAPGPEDKTKCNNWKEGPPPPEPPHCFGCLRKILFIGHEIEDVQAFQELPKMHTTNTLVVKIQNEIPKSKLNCLQNTVLYQLPKLFHLIAIPVLLYLKTLSGFFPFKELLTMHDAF